jgi:undecaprenyl-diphosphatase
VPADLTIFVAKYLVFVEGLICLGVLGVVLYKRPRLSLLRWVVTAVIILVVGYGFARIGAAVYSDPRPFTLDHVKPLIAHAADNGFPSDHALLAATLVALLVIAETWWAIPEAALAFLVDWARVGAGIHHVADVLGSTLFVAAATVVALAVAPLTVRILGRYLPTGPTDANQAATSRHATFLPFDMSERAANGPQESHQRR